MIEFLQSLGFIYVLIIIALIVLAIALIKSIFEIRDHLESIDNTLTAIAKQKYGIRIVNKDEQNNDDDYQLLS